MTTPEEKKAKKREARIRWRLLHPDQWREEKRNYQRRRYAKLQAALGKTTRQYKTQDPGTITLSRGVLGRHKGITQDEFDGIFKSQEGRCAICAIQLKRPWTMTGHSHRAHVDHCHRTGVIRGILCTNCNTGLGQFHDDAWRMRRAIEYLERGFSPT